MSDNQQFCLRWNNHQSTLVQVIDNLLSSGVLVDCTLAAEGQYLHAHKVVLCACSPYLETLLSQHYEKHPIVILKDVKFQELKSMMDYMYKGEVNISQDQLGQFLKAAESLQIKGLTDGGGGEGDTRDVGSTSQKRHEPTPVRKSIPHNQSRSPVVLPPHTSGLTIEPSKRTLPTHLSESQPDSPIRSREGSTSPTPRKRRRQRRLSQGEEDGHADNSCDLPMQSQSMSITSVPSSIPALSSGSSSTITKAPPPDEDSENPESDRLSGLPEGLLKEKIEPQSEMLLEPKTEYMDETNNDDSVEDLTLDDDDDYDGMIESGAGPSHGSNNPNENYAAWQQMASDRQDDAYLNPADGGHRDSQAQGAGPVIRVRSDIPNLKPLNFQNSTTFALLSTTNNFNVQNSSSAASNVMAISQHYLNKLNCLRMSPSQNWVSSSCDMYDSSSDTSIVSGDHHLNATTANNGNDNGNSNQQNDLSMQNNNVHSGPRKHNREKEPIFACLDCGKRYRSKTSLSLHKRLECGKEPAFQCPFCPLKTHQKGNLQVHIKKKHSDPRHFIGHQMS